MSAPKCRVCGVAEWWRHACFSAVPSRVKPDAKVKKPVVDAVAVKPAPPPAAEPRVSQSAPVSHVSQSTTYRHRDAEARRVYQRDLMRSRRRAARRNHRSRRR